MEKPNVNNLNGIGNFGHGFPEALSELPTNSMDNEEEVKEQTDVPANENEAEADNG